MGIVDAGIEGLSEAVGFEEGCLVDVEDENDEGRFVDDIVGEVVGSTLVGLLVGSNDGDVDGAEVNGEDVGSVFVGLDVVGADVIGETEGDVVTGFGVGFIVSSSEGELLRFDDG